MHTTQGLVWFDAPPPSNVSRPNGLRESYAILSHTWETGEVTFNDIWNLESGAGEAWVSED